MKNFKPYVIPAEALENPPSKEAFLLEIMRVTQRQRDVAAYFTMFVNNGMDAAEALSAAYAEVDAPKEGK